MSQTVGLRCICALLTCDAGRDFHVDHRLAPRPIEETPKDFSFLVSALLIFGLGSASFAEGGAPTLRVTLTPNARTVKTGDNVVYTVEFSCASTDANCDDAVLTVDVPRFANPDGAVNSEVAPVLAAATNTTGVVAPPTIAAPTRNSDGKVVYNLGTAPAGTAGQATITVRPPPFHPSQTT